LPDVVCYILVQRYRIRLIFQNQRETSIQKGKTKNIKAKRVLEIFGRQGHKRGQYVPRNDKRGSHNQQPKQYD
jgi:hypothetical protein